MKILVDMNLTPVWVSFLIENGIEALHWSSVGSPDSPDIDIFNYAKIHDFSIFTNDLDFGSILALTHVEKPSVIQARTPLLIPDTIGNIVVSTIKNLAEDIEKGALITINKNKIRVSLLPL